MKLAHVGWTVALVLWACSLWFQFDAVDQNEQLRRQLISISLERDNALNDLHTCEGDMRP